MNLFDELKQGARLLEALSPQSLRTLAHTRLNDVVLAEAARSHRRVKELQKRYPSAAPRELSQHLIEGRKAVAGTIGGVTGAFGLLGVPADLLAMAWVQVVLLVDVATAYGVNLKGERARAELLDVLGYANGVGPLQRAGPRLFGSVAGKLLETGGLRTLGRAMPLAAAPLSAWLNNRHIQSVGESAVRFYEGLEKAHAKSARRAAGKAS